MRKTKVLVILESVEKSKQKVNNAVPNRLAHPFRQEFFVALFNMLVNTPPIFFLIPPFIFDRNSPEREPAMIKIRKPVLRHVLHHKIALIE
jgi:hypothetical protein